MPNNSEDADGSDSKHPIGYKAWCQDYANKIINPEDLQAQIDAYMVDFEKKEADEKEAERRRAGEPDEEGWITVSRSGRRKGVPRTEAAAELAMEKRAKKSKETLNNFYVFQARESKLKHVADLRTKFEEDKKKIANLRSKTKFKPY